MTQQCMECGKEALEGWRLCQKCRDFYNDEPYHLKIFSGPLPFSKECEDCGTLLVNMPIEKKADGLNIKAKGIAIEDGTAGYYRVYNNHGRVLIQKEVSDINSDIKGAIVMPCRIIAKGNPININ